MDIVFKYLETLGYSGISKSYYSKIESWINIWKGNAKWLDIKDINGNKYPMYSLGMGKKVCEDLASTLTSEPFEIKGTKNDDLLQAGIKATNLMKLLPGAIEMIGYTGTVATVAHIKNATLIESAEGTTLTKNPKTSIELVNLRADQIIPLTIENGIFRDMAFVSEEVRMINNQQTEVIYLEVHELTERGYQITNKYFRKSDGSEIKIEGVVETYNTLSKKPLFSIGKLEKENVYEDSNGLGLAIFGDSIDQLQILDLTYNNFGMDFKLGQKVMVINKKLTKIIQEEYTDENGEVKTRDRIVYPSDLQKQLFTEMDNGIMTDGTENPYIYEYNPDLRVGANKEGVQFALDNLSFKCGFGTHYYSFESGSLTTATEAVLSRKDFVDNGTKNRKSIVEYLKGICAAILLCEKMLGNASIDETQEIKIPDADGFLEDENTVRERAKEDVANGLMSKKRYLMSICGMSEKDAEKELEEITKEKDAQMTFSQLTAGINQGVIKKEELRQFIKPKEDIETAKKAIEEIKALEPTTEELLGGKFEN